MTEKLTSWCVFLAIAVPSQCAWGDVYSLTDLGTPVLDTAHATGLDSTGRVVGVASGGTLFNIQEHAFLYSGGAMRDLHDSVVKALPSPCWHMSTTAQAITDSGIVIGWIWCRRGYHGSSFFYHDGAVNIVQGTVEAASKPGEFLVNGDARGYGIHIFRFDGEGVPRDGGAVGGVTGYASDMNVAGQVVGWSLVDPGTDGSRAWTWTNGQKRDLGTLGGPFSRAQAINSVGQVVGEADKSKTERHAFLYSDGLMWDLGTLGGPYSVAHGINSSGQIVGESLAEPEAGGSGSARPHAFLYENGAMKDLNRHLAGPAATFVTLLQARAINESGMIIANGVDSRRTGMHAGLRAYLLTPVTGTP
jgi:probable HAF family extracellular repeat protein